MKASMFVYTVYWWLWPKMRTVLHEIKHNANSIKQNKCLIRGATIFTLLFLRRLLLQTQTTPSLSAVLCCELSKRVQTIYTKKREEAIIIIIIIPWDSFPSIPGGFVSDRTNSEGWWIPEKEQNKDKEIIPHRWILPKEKHNTLVYYVTCNLHCLNLTLGFIMNSYQTIPLCNNSLPHSSFGSKKKGFNPQHSEQYWGCSKRFSPISAREYHPSNMK